MIRCDNDCELLVSFEDYAIVFEGYGKNVPTKAVEWLSRPELFVKWELVSFLAQIVEGGYAAPLKQKVLLGWEDMFCLLNSPDYSGAAILIGLPPSADLRMTLTAHGSMADPQLEINLEWRDRENRPLATSIARTGAIVTMAGKRHLLDLHSWRLAEEVRRFHRRTDRSQSAQEKTWARLRQMAKRCQAALDHYLERTVILTADKLDLSLRHTKIDQFSVVEVAPRITGISDDLWLTTFDHYDRVQDHYDLSTSEGSHIRVIIEPDTRAVLAEIKRMPGRRIAGERAEAFLRNPYAMLGDAMNSVVPPEAFEQARAQAGIHLYDFRCDALRDKGHIRALRITPLPRSLDAPVLPALELADRVSAKALTDDLERALANNAACFSWNGQTLELRGDSSEQLRQMRAWLCAAWAGEPLFTWNELLDISQYAERVESIGTHCPQYAPYLVKKDERGGWLPENLEEVILYTAPNGEAVIAPTAADQVTELEKWLATHPSPSDTFTPVGWPAPVEATEARRLVDLLRQARSKPPISAPPQEDPTNSTDPRAQSARATVVIKQNVLKIDYNEDRSSCLKFSGNIKPDPSEWLLRHVRLKNHQITGLAWLQHLWQLRQSRGVRGALLADDMGLGKTLQLLSFIAWYLEKMGETALPVLIVAPVSLLDNWQREILSFFDNRLAREILPLYGDSLRQRKLGRKDLESVAEHGVRGLLQPDWRGDKKLVLTTYETMRDLEISLARQPWSVMVCDEAQKIKTPGALMTHAAKAQNAMFRIACTGTPVENSLTDLWCLFDFIQPGLLGSLSEFCRTYRKPIETKNEEENVQLKNLRDLIEPQTIRRMKDEVTDLPPRLIQDNCKNLPLSPYQRQLYSQAACEARQRNYQDDLIIQKGSTVILGLLHRLRSICADPREAGTVPNLNVRPEEHCGKSPKLAWLLDQLDSIRKKQEKVIIFTEFRDLQRVLQHRISERFNFSPSIVNGSTRAGENKGELSRQRIIDSFQAKPGFNIIILSTTAIGFGVNIQKANHVIHFTRAWNPAKEDQATDRAHRIGQILPVHVYYPTIRADDFETFEVKLDSILKRKRELARDMLNGAGEITISEWNGLRAPGGSDIIPKTRINANHLSRLEATPFENLCRLYLERKGYSACLTSRAGDGGVDVVALKGSEGYLVQCKSSSRERNLSWEAIKEVKAGSELYSRQYPDVTFTLVAATNIEFNSNARKKANALKVQLWESLFWEDWLKREIIYCEDLNS